MLLVFFCGQSPSKPQKISSRRFQTACRARRAVKILECAGNQRATALFAAEQCDCKSGVALPPSADESLATALQSTMNDGVTGSERFSRHSVLLVFFVSNPIPNPGRFHPEDSEHLVAPQFIRDCLC
jgi:hypothetical protein